MPTSLVPADRDEAEFTIMTALGERKTVKLVEFVTIDDIMLVQMKTVAHSIFKGTEYDSTIDQDVRDFLVVNQVAHRGF